MSTSMIGWFARLGAAVASAAALSACGSDLSDVPLPSQVSGPTYEIEAVFDSALNLPRQAPVKLDGRTVGDVVSVEAVDYTARVRLRISDETRLPTGTRAQTRLSAPVGEAFVALLPPEGAAGGATLEHGDVLDREVTDTAPDTTDLLTGLSAAVTGGSYADLKVVIEELVTAFDGRGGDVRHLVRRLDSVVTSVNTHRDDIDAALDGLDRLSAQVADDTDSIAASADALAPAIQRLAEQEDEAIDLLTSLTELGDAGHDVIRRTKGTIASQLHDLQTVLEAIEAEQEKIGPILTGVEGFADGLDRATPGDYATFDLTILLNPKLGGDLPFLNLTDQGEPLTPPPFSPGKPPALPDLVKGLLAGLSPGRGAGS